MVVADSERQQAPEDDSIGVAESEICQVTQDVWTSVLGLEARAQPSRGVPLGDETSLTGCVHITGAFEGAVTLESSTGLARRATAILLGVEPGSATLEDV